MGVRLHDTTTSVSAAIADAYSILQELRDEVREAYDALPDSLQGGERGSTLDETASALENFCDDDPSDDLPLDVGDRLVRYGSNRRKRQSRSDRRDEAVRMLDAADLGIQMALEEMESNMAEDEEDDSELKQNVETAREVSERIQEASQEAEGVEFPGMYG